MKRSGSLFSKKTVKVGCNRPLLQTFHFHEALSKHFGPCAEYAQVLRMLGNGRLEAMCIDGTKRLCHIRGKMRKKVWVNSVSISLHRISCSLPAPAWAFKVLVADWSCGWQGDIILVGLRDYQDEKADVILKYASILCLHSYAKATVFVRRKLSLE